MQKLLDGDHLSSLTSATPAEFAAHADARLVYAVAKRTLDIIVATGLLIVAAPFWLLAALLIWWTSPGPVVYRQARSGRGGVPFTCLKFRTMYVDSDERLARDVQLRSQFERNWKLHRDPRVTPVGRVLRRTSIDELPQLINVLRGEMSIVGPRPLQVRELHEMVGPLAPVYTSVRPGLTSLWAVSGRSLVEYPRRIELELAYVRAAGLWLDLVIILRTIPAMLLQRGAI